MVGLHQYSPPQTFPPSPPPLLLPPPTPYPVHFMMLLPLILLRGSYWWKKSHCLSSSPSGSNYSIVPYWLCDLGKLLNLSEPQHPHLQNQESWWQRTPLGADGKMGWDVPQKDSGTGLELSRGSPPSSDSPLCPHSKPTDAAQPSPSSRATNVPGGRTHRILRRCLSSPAGLPQVSPRQD